MYHFEKFKKQLISSYESTLEAEGREISKELFKKINFLNKYGDDKFDIDKLQSYCKFILSFNKDFFIKCKKLNYDINNFKSIKSDLDSISETRKHQKEDLKE